MKVKLDANQILNVTIGVLIGMVGYHMVNYVLLPKIAPQLSSLGAKSSISAEAVTE